MSGEWQPIETAPRDGGYIIVARFKQDELKWVRHSRWMTAEETAEYYRRGPDDYEGGWTNGDDAGEHCCFVTHWMPLPSPPREGGR